MEVSLTRRRLLGGGLLFVCAMRLAPAVAGEATRRQLRFNATFTNPFSNELAQQKFWMYLPVRETSTQRLAGVTVSRAYELQHDFLGQTILGLSFDRLAPLEQKLVSIMVDIELFHAPQTATLTDPHLWLGAERFIETNDAQVRLLAQELRHKDDWDTGRAIYEWVAGNISYAGFVARDRGAADALSRRRGDCTEYAYLVVALARACDIPARMVGGFYVEGNAAPRADEYHNWSELYLDGAWRLADAQKRKWVASAENYIAFRLYREEVYNPLGTAHRYKVDGDVRVRL